MYHTRCAAALKAGQARGIPLEKARLCTICWTVHEDDDCPECRARQWIRLAPLLKGFLAPVDVPFGRLDA